MLFSEDELAVLESAIGAHLEGSANISESDADKEAERLTGKIRSYSPLTFITSAEKKVVLDSVESMRKSLELAFNAKDPQLESLRQKLFKLFS